MQEELLQVILVVEEVEQMLLVLQVLMVEQVVLEEQV
jgi:hypothetical protein